MKRVRTWLRLSGFAALLVASSVQADTPPALAPVVAVSTMQTEAPQLIQAQAGGAGPDNAGWLRRHWGRFVAQAHFDRAWRLQRELRLEEAATHFAQGLAIDPLHAAARLDYARLLVRLGRIAHAREAYGQALERSPGDTALRLELVELLSAHDEPAAALDLLESAEPVLHGRAAHLLRASELAQRLSQRERALSYALQAAEHPAADARERQQALESAFTHAVVLGRPGHARQILGSMSDYLDEQTLLRRRYALSQQAGDDQAALLDLQALLSRAQQAAERLSLLDAMLGHARRAHDSQAELDALTRALEASGGTPTRWRDLIAGYVRLGNPAAATRHALALARHTGHPSDRQAAASLVLDSAGRVDTGSLRELSAIAAAAGDVSLLAAIADAHLKRGESGQALSVYEAIAESSADGRQVERALRAAAHLSAQSGDDPARLRALEALAQRRPDDQAAQIARFEALLGARETERATQLLRMLASNETEPSMREALQLRLIDVVRLGGDAAEQQALRAMTQQMRMEPGAWHQALARLAHLYRARSDHEALADVLALRLTGPGLDEALRVSLVREYAMALWSAQRWLDAAEQFEWLHDTTGLAQDGLHAMRAQLAGGDRPQAIARARLLEPMLGQWAVTDRQAFLAEYGQLLADQGHTREALERWDRALSMGSMPDLAGRRDRLMADAALASGTRALVAGDWSVALAHYEQAEALAPQALTSESLAYAQLAAGQPARAAESLEQALRRDPSRTGLLPQAGYAWLGVGDAAKARQAFTQSLLAEASGSVALSPGQADQLRRELRDLNRRWGVSLYQSARSRDGRTQSAPGGQGSVLPSEGGVEVSWRLDPPAGSTPRELSLLARGSWSQPEGGLHVRSATTQGAVGVRWQPVSGSGLRLGLERLVGLGDEARDDWLARIGWSWAVGDEIVSTRPAWWTAQTWVDAGWFAKDGGSRALYGEARLGRSQRVADGWVMMPHVLVNGRTLAPDPRGESWLEAGVGVSLRREFGATPLEAARGRLELSLQWKQAIEPGRRDAWVFGVSVSW
jgi:Tfp pilus assembly protein PilF